VVVSAHDGPAMLAMIGQEAGQVDLVLTDYNLPGGMNGVEVLAALRARFGEHLPGIVLTGDISQDTLTWIEMADCVLLNKPVPADVLHAAIARLTSPQDRPDDPDVS
jgi:two-component system CheB/CheR fusion protein